MLTEQHLFFFCGSPASCWTTAAPYLDFTVIPNWTHHNLWDSTGRVISLTYRALPDNTQHSQQTPMPLTGFEPAVPANKRPQTHALDRAATSTGQHQTYTDEIYHTTWYFDIVRPVHDANSIYQTNLTCTEILKQQAHNVLYVSALLECHHQRPCLG